MNLHSIRGGSKQDLESNEYNIGVGISLGNKWFNVENIIDLVKWSLLYSKDKVVVYVADSIHALNIEARSGVSNEKAMRKALEMGNTILEEVKNKIDNEFSESDKLKIEYVHWDELKDEAYNSKLKFLYEYFENNLEFKNAILDIVKDHLSKEVRTFEESEINLMAYYILEELPECVSRVKIGTIAHDAFAYPTDGQLTDFVERIQNGETFPEVGKRILDTEPKVFLEVR